MESALSLRKGSRCNCALKSEKGLRETHHHHRRRRRRRHHHRNYQPKSKLKSQRKSKSSNLGAAQAHQRVSLPGAASDSTSSMWYMCTYTATTIQQPDVSVDYYLGTKKGERKICHYSIGFAPLFFPGNAGTSSRRLWVSRPRGYSYTLKYCRYIILT